MFTIVGLGNPGTEYENTRHNVGWTILGDIVARHKLPFFSKSSQYAGQLSEGLLLGVEVGILLPTTFMNNSGSSVGKYVKEKGSLETLVVVHDDIDLAVGEVKISYDRGPGGHNGVKSVIDACGSTKFIRIRIGIAQKGFFGGIKRPKGEKLSNFVLGKFKGGEVKQLTEVIQKVDKALELILTKGYQSAMQEVNGKE